MERLGLSGEVAKVGTEMPLFRFLTEKGEILLSFPVPTPRSPGYVLGVPRDKLDQGLDPIPNLIRLTPDNAVATRHFGDRALLRSACQGTVVLLGDAAHPMTLHRGQGGNAAMVDAIKLSDAFVEADGNIGNALAIFGLACVGTCGPISYSVGRGAAQIPQ